MKFVLKREVCHQLRGLRVSWFAIRGLRSRTPGLNSVAALRLAYADI